MHLRKDPHEAIPGKQNPKIPAQIFEISGEACKRIPGKKIAGTLTKILWKNILKILWKMHEVRTSKEQFKKNRCT